MPAKTKPRVRAAKETSAAYESSNEQYLPVRDKSTVLDTIFQDPDVKHYRLDICRERKERTRLVATGQQVFVT